MGINDEGERKRSKIGAPAKREWAFDSRGSAIVRAEAGFDGITIDLSDLTLRCKRISFGTERCIYVEQMVRELNNEK